MKACPTPSARLQKGKKDLAIAPSCVELTFDLPSIDQMPPTTRTHSLKSCVGIKAATGCCWRWRWSPCSCCPGEPSAACRDVVWWCAVCDRVSVDRSISSTHTHANMHTHTAPPPSCFSSLPSAAAAASQHHCSGGRATAAMRPAAATVAITCCPDGDDSSAIVRRTRRHETKRCAVWGWWGWGR